MLCNNYRARRVCVCFRSLGPLVCRITVTELHIPTLSQISVDDKIFLATKVHHNSDTLDAQVVPIDTRNVLRRNSGHRLL